MKIKAMNKSVVLSLTLCLTLLLGSCAQVSTGAPDSTEGGLTKPVSVSVPVSAKNGETAKSVVLSGDGVRATVPAGVKLEQDVKELTLTVTPMDASKGGITAGEKEDVLSVDVHVSGVAADNTTPIAVELGNVMPKYLNMGNYELYHVEDGAANAMSASAQLDGHNEFFYDVYSGGLTVAMASFSEVSVVSNTENKWQGGVDTAWYNTTDAEFEIVNGDQLNGLAKIVSGTADGIAQDSFAGKTVRLIADVDLDATTADKVFYPIGVKADGMNAFEGAFDGAGHTVSNFYQNGSDSEAMGLFACVAGGTVKNLTIDNFASKSELAPTGCVSAYAEGECTFENIAIINCAPSAFNTGVAGIVGRDAGESSSFTFRNITVDASNKVSAMWGSWDVAAAGLLGYLSGNSSAVLDNCHVTAVMDVYNDVCGNQQYGWYRNSGMMIGSVDKTKADGSLDLSNVTATNCSVSFGDAHEYYYCEFEENGMTVGGDYRYSRVAECVGHDHTAAEDKQAVYLPFRQLFGGFGFGVDGVDLGEYENVDISVATTSAVKFETSAQENYTSESSVTVGELFAAIAGVNPAINTNNVQVFVSPVGEESTAGAIYEANKSDWTQGTVTFSGLGEATVTVTDYFFCTPTTISITVTEPVMEPVDKFVPAEGLVYYHTTQGGTIETTLGEIFTAVDGVSINSATVEVSFAGNGATGTYTANTSDWTQGKITLSGVGTVEVSVTDQDYCNTATAIVSVQEPDPAEKFEVKFPNVDEYLYRVGNGNTVALGSLFSALDGAQIGTVSVTVTPLNGAAVSGTYTANSDWTKATLKFTGTGPVKITVQDNNFCLPTELCVEVVNANNATSAASATKNNVVLLNDVGLSTITVSGGHTLYGNGFKMTAASDVLYYSMNAGFVSLNNGTLDNVQIVCPNFSHAVIYNANMTESENYYDSNSENYGNVRSAVMVDGESKIVNSYISGGRAGIFLKSGNLLVDNSTIMGGAAANIHAISAQSLTLRDATLIQKPIQATVHDTSKTLFGFSGLFECDESGLSTPLILEGKLMQSAWIDKSDQQYIPSDLQSVVGTALSKTAYLHDLDGDGTAESLNLGFTYIPQNAGGATTPVVTDNRTNKAAVPYSAVEVSVSVVKATVYSYEGGSGTSDECVIGDAFVYAPDTQAASAPTLVYSDTSENRVFETAFDASNSRWQSTLTVDLDAGDYSFSFDKLLAQKYGQNLSYTVVKADGTSVDKGSAIVMNDSGVTEYVLTVTDDVLCGPDGADSTSAATHTLYFTLTATKTSIQPPVKVAEPGGTPLLVVKSKNSDWSCAIPALEGTQIKYYSKTQKDYVTLSLSDLTPTSTGKQNGTESYWEYAEPNGDYTLKVTCGVIHDTKSVYGMPVVVNNGGYKMYFTISSTNGYVSTSTASRTVTISYDFTDSNGNTLSFSKTWQFNYADYSSGTQYSYSDFVSGNLKEASSSSCVTPDTLVTLADGTQKRIDQVTASDMLLVWDFYKGEYASVPSAIIFNHGYGNNKVIELNFSDGTVVKAINLHQFFDAELNRFVTIDEETVAQYVGHEFIKQNGESYEAVTLTDYEVRDEYIQAYGIITALHYNVLVEGMFSTDFMNEDYDLFNYFAFGQDMKFDAEQMQADIEKYGLYTYEDFADYLTYEQFVAFNVPYFKIAVGKGVYTYEGILDLIDEYLNR